MDLVNASILSQDRVKNLSGNQVPDCIPCFRRPRIIKNLLCVREGFYMMFAAYAPHPETARGLPLLSVGSRSHNLVRRGWVEGPPTSAAGDRLPQSEDPDQRSRLSIPGLRS